MIGMKLLMLLIVIINVSKILRAVFSMSCEKPFEEGQQKIRGACGRHFFLRGRGGGGGNNVFIYSNFYIVRVNTL